MGEEVEEKRKPSAKDIAYAEAQARRILPRRLRERAASWAEGSETAAYLDSAAADEIESLRASLTRVEEETLAAIEPFIRHGRSIENERNLRIWTDRGYREVPREDFDRLSALKARLSRAISAEGK